MARETTSSCRVRLEAQRVLIDRSTAIDQNACPQPSAITVTARSFVRV